MNLLTGSRVRPTALIVAALICTIIYTGGLPFLSLFSPADAAKKTYSCAFISGGTQQAPATIVGKDNKDDVIQGTSGDDVIVGLGGNDIIFGNGGNDTICGGDGDDWLGGDAGNDIIEGNGGNDKIIDCCGTSPPSSIESGNDIISGGDGIDSINALHRVTDKTLFATTNESL